MKRSFYALCILTFIVAFPLSHFGQWFWGVKDLDSSCTQMKLEVKTAFPFGAGLGPALLGYSVTNSGGALTMDLYYKMSGPQLAFFSQRVDTIDFTVPVGSSSFLLRLKGDYPNVNYAFDSTGVLLCLPEGFSEHLNEEPEWSISPNPGTDDINLYVSRAAKVEKLSVLDLAGREVVSLDGSMETFNISDLPAGLYFVKLQTNKRSSIKKLIKKD